MTKNDSKMTFFTTLELAERWPVSARTLEGWRYTGKGPSYVKFGSRVAYPLEVVEEFECRNFFRAWVTGAEND